MGFCRVTSRSVVGFIAFLFLVIAAVLWGIAGFVIATYNKYDRFLESNLTLIPAVIAIVVGILFFFAAILGFCATCKDNRCVLSMFGVFLFLLLALMITAAVTTYVFKDQIQSGMHNMTMDTIDKYGDENATEHKSIVQQVDYAQQHLKCCGVDNYTDWETTFWGTKHPGRVPQSCCRNMTACPGGYIIPEKSPKEVDKDIYAEGCYQELKDMFVDNLGYIGSALIVLVVLLVLGLICSCALCCLKRRDDAPYFSLN